MPEPSPSSHSTETSNDKKKKSEEQASVGETLSFVFNAGGSTMLIFVIGVVAGIGNGLVYPILAYLFSSSFSDISSASNEGLAQVRELAYTFLVVGAYALVMATIQTTCFETVAYRASQNLKLSWFQALLRQDPAFFDVHDVGGIAATVGPSANRYRRGVGRKFGEGIQFFTTGVGGIGYALFSSWRVALVVLAVTPFISISAFFVVNFNQSKTKRAADAYKE